MSVPASLAALSTTAASNPPAGTDSVFPELDDHLRTIYSFEAQLRDQKAPLASPTFTGVVTSPQYNVDVNATWALVGGNPVLTFDSGDSISYDRGADTFNFRVGTTVRMTLTTSGPERPDDASTPNGLPRKSQIDSIGFIGQISPGARLTAPTGWLLIDGKTIGSAASGATSRANADTLALFTVLWDFAATAVPIYTSAGAPSTRGASAAADFAANKRLGLFTPDGGAFFRMWTPTQTVDAGRLAGSAQSANAGTISATFGGDDGDAQVSANSSWQVLNFNGVNFNANFDGGVTKIIPITASNSTTAPYNLAMPHYIRYA